MKKILLILFLLVTANSFAATRTAVTNGSWSSAATWGGTVPQPADIAVIPAGITVTLNVNGNFSNPNTIRVSGKMIVLGSEPLFSNPCTLEVLSGGELNDQTIANQLLFMHTSFLKIQTGGKWTSSGGFETLIYNSNYSAEYQFQNMVMNGPFQISVYANQVTYSTTVLPLKLINFSGKQSAVNNLLNWETASEVNTDAFYIERSSDAMHYETLGKVASKKSSGENHYSYTDRTALSGNNFYRLKMTDLNGTYTYSEIPVNIKRDAASQISVFPSPAKDFVTVVTGTAGILSIYSADGKLVSKQHLLAGNSIIDVNKLQIGIYFIVQAGQKTSFIKTF